MTAMKNLNELFDKTREFADKAENVVSEEFTKIRESEIYVRVSDSIEQISSFAEHKIEEFKKDDFPSQLDHLRGKAESIVDKTKTVGSKLAGELEDVLDSLKGKQTGNGKK